MFTLDLYPMIHSLINLHGIVPRMTFDHHPIVLESTYISWGPVPSDLIPIF